MGAGTRLRDGSSCVELSEVSCFVEASEASCLSSMKIAASRHEAAVEHEERAGAVFEHGNFWRVESGVGWGDAPVGMSGLRCVAATKPSTPACTDQPQR